MIGGKKHLWVSAIILLLALDLWKWVPVRGPERASKEHWKGTTLEFPSQPEDGLRKAHRDIFNTLREPARPRSGARAGMVWVPTPPPTRVVSDESVLEAEGGYRLMGVISYGGKSRALIGKGSRIFQVEPGDSLEDRYQVERVTENEVDLAEKATGSILKLRVWDPRATQQGQGTI